MNAMTTPARGPDDRGRALFLLAIGVLSVGAAAILVRLANVHPLTASWVRLSIGGAVLLAITVGQRRPLPHGPDLRRAVVAGVLLAAHFGLWIGSLSFTTVTASVVLVCLQPVFVVVGGAIIIAHRHIIFDRFVRRVGSRQEIKGLKRIPSAQPADVIKFYAIIEPSMMDDSIQLNI